MVRHTVHARFFHRLWPLFGVFYPWPFQFFFCELHLGDQKGHFKEAGFSCTQMIQSSHVSELPQLHIFLPRIHRPGLSCFQEYWDESKRSPNSSIEEMVHHRESMFGGKKGTRLIVEMLGHSWEDSLMLKFVQNSSNTWADVQKIIESYGVFMHLGVSISAWLMPMFRHCLKWGYQPPPQTKAFRLKKTF